MLSVLWPTISIKIEKPPGAFSDWKAGTPQWGRSRSASSRLRSSWNAADQVGPRPGVRRNVEGREPKQTRTDAQDG
jgi:hypothetical protein